MATKKENKQKILISNTFLSEKLISNECSFEILESDFEIFDTSGYPNTIKWAVERLFNMFDDDYSFHFPSLDTARGTFKKQRKTRSYAMLKIICVMIKMMCLESMRIGRYNKANRWNDASIEKIAKTANVSLSNTKKILTLLAEAGFIDSNQKITSLDIKKGVFKVSKKSFTKNFFDCLNLTAQRLKEMFFFKKEKEEESQLNKKLPQELRSTNTPQAKMVRFAEKVKAKLKKTG